MSRWGLAARIFRRIIARCKAMPRARHRFDKYSKQGIQSSPPKWRNHFTARARYAASLCRNKPRQLMTGGLLLVEAWFYTQNHSTGNGTITPSIVYIKKPKHHSVAGSRIEHVVYAGSAQETGQKQRKLQEEVAYFRKEWLPDSPRLSCGCVYFATPKRPDL